MSSSLIFQSYPISLSAKYNTIYGEASFPGKYNIIDAEIAIQSINVNFSDNYDIKDCVFNIKDLERDGNNLTFKVQINIADDGGHHMSGDVNLMLIGVTSSD